MQWYYAIDGKQFGPVDESRLRELVSQGQVKTTDLVWNETMGDQWCAAGKIAGLFGGGPVVPPPSRSTDEFTSARRGEISATAPVGPAWACMKSVLFTPFDIGKWFALGVSAWLATLGAGGAGGNFPSPGGFNNANFHGNGSPRAAVGEDIAAGIAQARTFLHEYGAKIALIGVPIVILVLLLGFALLWVRSRGRFMFLDNLLHDRTDVKAPWKAFRKPGNSLFAWSVCYSLITMVIGLGLLAAILVSALGPSWAAGDLVMPPVGGLIFGGAALLFFALATSLIGLYLESFVVPIMYQFNLSATAAWGLFLQMFGRHSGKFIVYALFYLVLSLAAGVIVMLAVLVTCCIAGCLMGIPYIGAVVLLPVTVFFRAYSLGYLAQFGSEYNLWETPRAQAPATPMEMA